MFRKLSLAVAISGLLSPVGVHALGLGDIDLDSALNQPLKAHIALHSVNQVELDDVKVDLASPDAFARAGIERPFHLSGLRFNARLNNQGLPVVVVSSKEPVREPFLNFLVEVNWPKGRLVREYTVLLDPPVTVQRKAARIEQPVTTAPVRETAGRMEDMQPASTPARISSAGREYGPVQTKDTLWNVANSLREGNESVEQVMMALLEYNPGAFIRNNVNGLKQGAILRLPASDEITLLSRREARNEFLAQTQQWKQKRAIKPTAAPDEMAGAKTEVEAPTAQDRLRLASATDKATEQTAAPEGVAAKSQDVAKLEQEVMLVREANEVARQEGEELRTRIKDLEAQLTDIQRLLTLRNDELAQLQQARQPEEPAISQQEIEAPVPAAAVAPMEQEPAQPESTVIAEPPETAEADQPGQTEQPVAPPAAEQTVTVASAEVKPETVVAPTPKTEVKTPERKSFMANVIDGVRENTVLLGIAGAVAVIMLSLMWIVARRRREAEAEFAESILVTPQGEQAASLAAADVGLAAESSEETSLLSDFSPSDIDALQDETGEVDPLSEADVYIAYGRYQQAEELIKQAIEKDSDRVELKFKLLEIFYSTRNKDDFSELAQRLVDSGADQTDPDGWAQVVSMGRELDAAHPLFSVGDESEAGLPAEEESLSDSVLDDISELGDFDLSDLEGDLALAEGQEQKADLGGEETQFSEADLSAELAEIEDEKEEFTLDLDNEADESLQLDGDTTEVSLTLEEDTTDISIDLDSEFNAELDDSLGLNIEDSEIQALGEDLDFDLGEFSETTTEDLSAGLAEGVDETQELLESVDIDLESMNVELEELSSDLTSEEELDVDLDELSGSFEETADEGEGVLSSDLAVDDEVGTKLDLARAYAEMGDVEGAQNILEEVINEGTDDQREQAESLLQEIT